jgi:hypothetical protein
MVEKPGDNYQKRTVQWSDQFHKRHLLAAQTLFSDCMKFQLANILLHVWSYTKLCRDVLKYLPLWNNE